MNILNRIRLPEFQWTIEKLGRNYTTEIIILNIPVEIKMAVYGGRKTTAESTKRKIKWIKKDSGVAKTIARVLALACANEHLLRNMDSLVAVQ